ncbi:NB-ARC domain-containing protein [Streptomyces sp. NPDC001401]|uniref:DUF7779 domain-containing protein n=1 Tax=Streptomyces sp. NPDC001401 TaxID=3364570 RepID=UPI0036B314E9
MRWRFRRKERHRGAPVAPAGGPEAVDGDEDALRAVAKNTGAAITIGGGFANTGLWIDRSVRQEAPRRPARWPHIVGSPPGRALGFQERAESSRLRQVLEAEGTAVVGQVLSGLGGVGKTQIAAEYARTAFEAGRLDVLVWITAVTRQAIVDGYARAAVELLAVEPDEHAAQRFVAWLQPSASRPVCRWLVVLDDLADPADVTGMWPPACPHGRTVVTTRRRDAALTGPGRRRVDVGVFTPTEAAAVLRQALADRDHPTQPSEQIQGLAQELGFLPLALSQAAAYIADGALDLASYRTRLADRTLSQLLPRSGHGQPGETHDGDTLPDGQAATVAAAWSLSLERAARLHPQGLARPMLQLAAMLDPNGIPQQVLTSAPALHHLTVHRTPPLTTAASPAPAPSSSSALAPGAVDEEDALAALRTLHRLSLIDHDPGHPNATVRVHQLVQRTTRETLTTTDQEQLARTAADALEAAWPPHTEFDDALVPVLRANAECVSRYGGGALWSPGVHPVLLRVTSPYAFDENVTYFSRLLQTAREHLGPDHPDTLTIRRRLALTRGSWGSVADAAAELDELLADQQRVLGPDHPMTQQTRQELGIMLWKIRGDRAMWALDVERRVFGSDPPKS